MLVNLYKTRSNINKIIQEFGLNNFYNEPGIELIELNLLEESDHSSQLTIISNNDSFILLDENKNQIFEGLFNKKYIEDEIHVYIKKRDENIPEIIEFVYFDPSFFYKSYYNQLNLETIVSSSFTSTEGLIKVSLVTEDPERGINIINYANKLFLENSIEFESEKARKAIDFIDKQLASINVILDAKKQNLKNFKEDNQSINVDLEIQSIIEAVSKIEASINEVEIEFAEASSTYTNTNPILRTISERRDILVNQKKEIESRIKNLPIAEQQYIDLYRDVEISQALYIDLSNRKLGFSIMEASTLGNIRIVDDAFIDVQTGPRLLYTFLSTVFFFVISLIISLVRAFYFLPITNPAEINDNGINAKIFGVIPYLETDDHKKKLVLLDP